MKKALFLNESQYLVKLFWKEEFHDLAKKFDITVDIPAWDGDIKGHDWAAVLPDYDVAITTWWSPLCNAEFLKTAKKLKLIAHAAGSVGSVVDDSTYDAGLHVTSCNYKMAEGVALGALFNTLWAWRNLPAYAKIGNFCPLRWDQRELSHNTKEMTVGIWGYGHIAQHLVRMLRGLPFKEILVYCDHVSPEEMASHGATLATSLDEIFEKSDVIHLCAGSNPQTFGTVNARLLAKIKDGATFINSGRAHLVDREALYAELAKNRFNAILDVHYKEPVPDDDPILTFPNVICTPHNSGNRDNVNQNNQRDYYCRR